MSPSLHQGYVEAEQALQELQKNELSIIRLAEPVRLINGEAKRGSDASADASDSPTPASFAADLSHYKVGTPKFKQILPLTNRRSYSQN